MSKTNTLIDELADFYGSNDMESGLQSRYAIPNEDELNELALFSPANQKKYFDLFKYFLSWVNELDGTHNHNDAKLLSKMGQHLLMYNELINAIEEDADKMLTSSKQIDLMIAQNDPSTKAAKDYLDEALAYFSDTAFLSKSNTDRKKVLTKLQHVSGAI